MWNANAGVCTKCNAEPPLTITPKDYIRKYTDNSEIRIQAPRDLKRNLRQRYEIFYRPIKRARATSYKSQKKKKILPKKKKRFEYGNVITESLIVLDDSLFPFRDKLNCAVKLEKPSYLEVLPQEDGMEGYIQWHWIKRHS